MMFKLLRKEKINTGRQYNLDLLKALAIVAMIICHTVTILSEARPGYESEFGYWMADIFLGSYLAVAHAFMFCMGVGFVYSRNSSPKSLLKRGIKIYVLAYVLNFFRGGIYVVVAGIFEPSYRELLYYTLCIQDILQFAGLAMMLTALFKKLKLDCRLILLIAVVMSVISQLTALKFNGNGFTNILVGSFVPTVEDSSTFVLFGWYIFVAAGICFGEVLQRIKDLNRFYKYLLGISSAAAVVYIILSAVNGCFFLSPGRIYYYAGILEAAGLMSIDFVLMSLMYFALKKLPEGRLSSNPFLRICFNMSRNINEIYFAQWCIIGLMTAVLIYLLELPLPYYVTYPASLAVGVLSYLAAGGWIKLKNKRKSS